MSNRKKRETPEFHFIFFAGSLPIVIGEGHHTTARFLLVLTHDRTPHDSTSHDSTSHDTTSYDRTTHESSSSRSRHTTARFLLVLADTVTRIMMKNALLLSCWCTTLLSSIPFVWSLNLLSAPAETPGGSGGNKDSMFNRLVNRLQKWENTQAKVQERKRKLMGGDIDDADIPDSNGESNGWARPFGENNRWESRGPPLGANAASSNAQQSKSSSSAPSGVGGYTSGAGSLRTGNAGGRPSYSSSGNPGSDTGVAAARFSERNRLDGSRQPEPERCRLFRCVQCFTGAPSAMWQFLWRRRRGTPGALGSGNSEELADLRRQREMHFSPQDQRGPEEEGQTKQ